MKNTVTEFKCPVCGSNRFGSMYYHRNIGDKFPHRSYVGHCNGQKNGKYCDFLWLRNGKEDEKVFIEIPIDSSEATD